MKKVLTQIACGSCSIQYDGELRECPNCSFPNRRFAEPDLSPIEIKVELAVQRTMAEIAQRRGVEVSALWQEAAEWWINDQNTQKRRAK